MSGVDHGRRARDIHRATGRAQSAQARLDLQREARREARMIDDQQRREEILRVIGA